VKSTLKNVRDYEGTVPLSRFKDNIIALEDLDFLFSRNQLETIADLHNDGMWVTDIAERIERNEYEVLIALIHLHRAGRLTKHLAYRRVFL